MMLVIDASTEHFARREAGGKGYNLYRLTKLGLDVPDWVVLGCRFFRSFIECNGLNDPLAGHLDSFAAGRSSAAETASAIAALFEAAALSPEMEAEARGAYDRVAGNEKRLISVRSSAADEDGPAHSFAGQLSSFLYVDSPDLAVQRVKDCWASLFSERALVYRRERGIPLQGAQVAVVFQRMIDPDVSGVLFTCDPNDESTERYLATAVYGVGEGLVSGLLDADSYWLEAGSGALLRQEIAPKIEAMRRGNDSAHSVVTEPVAPDIQERPCLNAGQLAGLHAVGKQLAEFYGIPQDIEWALKGDELHILQTRPVTTLTSNRSGYPNLWDNSNIVESYGGLTLPLSFTFALRNYKAVYVQFCELLGVPAGVIKDMEPYLGNMLGCLDGRVYYNLYNWYKLVGVLPGFRNNREFMETMMGVTEELSREIGERIRPHPSWDTPAGKWRRLVSGLSFLRYHFTIQRMVNRFLSDFKRAYDDFRHRPYDRMSSDAILSAYLDMESAMMRRWKAPIVNDFLVMVHFGIFRRLTKAWLGAVDPNLQNDLLAGEGHMESAEPTNRLIELAGLAAADPALRELIEQTPEADALEALNQSSFQSFTREVMDYIDRFGFRCMNEMKLEETDLFSDPSFFFTCLKNYLRSGVVSLEEYGRRRVTLRRTAEDMVAMHLRGWRRMVFGWSLRHARKAVRNRENTRFARTRAYGIARSMFQAMGADLRVRGILDEARDVFYLYIEEVIGLHQGTLPLYDLKPLVALRKQAYARYAREEPPSRFMTRGPVYWDQPRTGEESEAEADAGDGDLRGLPCCPGVVEGVVKVVQSPHDDLRLDGEILVTTRTDPGWVPLYPSVSGLLVERGSLLSHSAIVAREMGLPTIVSVKGLTQRLKTGMHVRLDGQRGVITIL